MTAHDEERPARPGRWPDWSRTRGVMALGGLILVGLGLVMTIYNACKIEVDTAQQAVLIRREGLELEPDI